MVFFNAVQLMDTHWLHPKEGVLKGSLVNSGKGVSKFEKKLYRESLRVVLFCIFINKCFKNIAVRLHKVSIPLPILWLNKMFKVKI